MGRQHYSNTEVSNILAKHSKSKKTLNVYIYGPLKWCTLHMPCSSGQALLLANAAMNYKKREISIYLG